MAEKRFLVIIETQKVKGYLFASPILRETRGASLLLDTLNRKETEQLLTADPGVEVVYLGGAPGGCSSKRRTKQKSSRSRCVNCINTGLITRGSPLKCCSAMRWKRFRTGRVLLAQIRALKAADVPRTKLKALYPVLFQSVMQAQFAAQHIKERLAVTGALKEGPLHDLVGSLPLFPFRAHPPQEWSTPLSEIIELYDFVHPTSPATPPEVPHV